MARQLSPRVILAIGWLGLLVYAHPGYLSSDAIDQLVAARAGELTTAHPPLMTALWKLVDTVIPGPLGMLVIQSGCLLAGAHLVLSRALPERRAAVAAVVVLWFPPIAATLAVIWPDSLFCGLLLLGTGLLVHDRRVAGLVLVGIASTLHVAGLAITLPIVVLLFAAHEGWQRYVIAAAAWLVATAVPHGVVYLIATDAPVAAAPAQQAYVWFTAVGDLSVSAGRIGHDARPSGLQSVSHRVMMLLGSTWLFAPLLYVALALGLISVSIRDRTALAVLVSGLTGALVTVLLDRDVHFRSACWLAVCAVLAVGLRLAAAVRARPST